MGDGNGGDGNGVLLRTDGVVARITLNRPHSLNVLDAPMAQALADALGSIERAGAVKVLVLDGAGRSFMGGGDLNVFHADLERAPETASRLIELFHQSIRCIKRLPIPVIAGIHGPVAGGGVGLALACDLIIAAADTRLVPAYGRIGTSPDGGTSWSLTRLLGPRRAMEVLMIGEPIGADQLKTLGLVNRVVPPSELASATEALAKRLAAGPRVALANVKRLVQQAQTSSLEVHLEAERNGFVAAAATADFREGIAAFFAGRSPTFAD
ncbi:MAG: enoyl-CoA hydratase/isomerase family protein [Hyphomonadaceae bacterium]|nr:enoyl-CoA hydratase/isomerase family protein [Hyphomonadaceae bacterium]